MELVKFAASFYDTEVRNGLVVNVKNSRFSYRGRAYDGIPTISPFYGKAKRLVVLAVGDNSKFPQTNEVERISWVKVKSGETYESSQVRSVGRGNENWLEKRIVTKQSYGGKNAPVYTMNNWKEALVAIAGHELAHIYQYVNNLGTGEHFTETKANEILNAYRKSLTS